MINTIGKFILIGISRGENMSYISNGKEYATLDEMLEDYRNNRTKWEKVKDFIKYGCGIWTVKRHLKDLYYNLHWNRIKHLLHMIKFWWNYNDFTSYKGLEFLYWHLQRVLEVSELTIIYENQEEYNKELIEVIECLRKELEEDFGEINEIEVDKYIQNADDNFNRLIELLKNHHRWGI